MAMMIMNDDLSTQIEALFDRCPELCGFSVRDPADIPDSCTRSETGGDLFVTDIGISSLTSFSPHIRANKIRAIAVTGEKRTPALPDTPTLEEQGIKSFPSYSWWGVYAPAGVPRPLIDRMHAEIKKAVLSPDVTQKFIEQFNMEILTSSPEDFAAYQKNEQDRWFKVIKENDIKGD